MNIPETSFQVRETPWSHIGTIVQEAPNSSEALRLAGLDWEVESRDLYLENGLIVPKFKANVRSSDGSVLGVVSEKYKIVQNTEAFQFVDELIGGDVHYESAGAFHKGKQVWLLVKMENYKIVGDDVQSYLCFTNTFDGTGSIRAMMTPIRVICNNLLNLAMKKATRSWSMIHKGDMQSKLLEARMSLELADKYMYELNQQAEIMANTTVTEDQIESLLDKIFPVNENDSERKKRNAAEQKDAFYICYHSPDISQFIGTSWGVYNAVSDLITHGSPQRLTPNYRENNFSKMVAGNTLIDVMARELIAA